MEDRAIEHYRREFPVVENYIYLDHAGVAPISLRVRKAIEGFLREISVGGAFRYPLWAKDISGIRARCAELIGAESDEIAFVKSTSHGLSLVASGLDWRGRDNLIFCERDFPSNIYPWLHLEKRGIEARPVPHRQGRIMIDDIEERMDARTRLVAVSSVQFSTGARIDLKGLGSLCRDRNILLCVDAIQGLGVVPMNVREFKIDFLSADAHKWLLGPEGIGIFYCRKGLAQKLDPAIVGWKSVVNEFDFDHPNFQLKDDAGRFEEGSQNVMGIFGLGAAVDLLLEVGINNVQGRVMSLGDVIIGHVEKRGFELMTPKEREERGGAISFRGAFDPAVMRDRLREKNIIVNARGGGLRVSPHFYNTEQEIEQLFQTIDSIGKG
jgi:cysteine desulfurase / selenocysteine lyase